MASETTNDVIRSRGFYWINLIRTQHGMPSPFSCLNMANSNIINPLQLSYVFRLERTEALTKRNRKTQT